MASITEVKIALKRNDRKRALELLSEVLKKQQSAEAWYLAAKLTSKEDKARAYLRRALLLDKNHVPSRDMLRQLKGEAKLKRSNIKQVIQDEIGGLQPKANSHRVEVNPKESKEDETSGGVIQWQQIALVVLSLVFLVLSINLIRTRFSSDDASTTTKANTATEAIVIQAALELNEKADRPSAPTQELLNAYAAIGYYATMTSGDDFSNASLKYAMRVDYEGGSGYAYLYVFNQTLRPSDARPIAQNLPGYHVDTGSNLVLAVPEALDEATVESFYDIFLQYTQVED